jgi:hypothetical protein
VEKDLCQLYIPALLCTFTSCIVAHVRNLVFHHRRLPPPFSILSLHACPHNLSLVDNLVLDDRNLLRQRSNDTCSKRISVSTTNHHPQSPPVHRCHREQLSLSRLH